MAGGAPEEVQWRRVEPRRNLPKPLLDRMVRRAFPGSRVVDIQPLTDGFRNANFKLLLEPAPDPLVLRVYEHDASICQKELDLLRLVAGGVPVPEVVHAEAGGFEDLPPFLLMRYVEGISFRDLCRGGDREAIAQAACSAGETLAAIGRHTFKEPGWISPGLRIPAPLLEGADPFPRFVDLCLESGGLQRRVPAGLRDRIHKLVSSRSGELAEMSRESRLVHGDLNKRNLLVRCAGGRWEVAAVLDWEFAVSGSPLADIGNFLRYENPQIEPHFSSAYVRAGARLPSDWRFLSKLIDLTAVCEILTRDKLPDEVCAEMIGVLLTTCE